jgi:hypothetical protein
MNSAAIHPGPAFILMALGLALAAFGLYVCAAADPPGAAVMGMFLMVAGVVLLVRGARPHLSRWLARTAMAVGVGLAGVTAFLIHDVTVSGALFPQPQSVPAVANPEPAQQYAAAAGRARELARNAVLEQNLPGVSVAVGASGAIVWAEGFGWRDVATETPVTPETRFNIGTAAAAVEPAVAPLGLTHTGAEAAAEWSPGHIGEPEDDFPPFTLAHDIILRPLGISAPAQPLPRDRATFYVPRSANDPRSGRRLMYMRHLACCANGMAFYSTPSDLVRFALARNPGSINGELAGGMVTSLSARNGVVVAVASNIAHADTALLAQHIADAFAIEPR